MFVVAGSNTTTLFQAHVAAFNHVAFPVGARVERRESATLTALRFTLRDLVGSFRNGVRDLALP